MHPRSLLLSNGARALTAALCLAAFATGAAADCTASAAPDCYRAFEPPQAGGSLHYYASLAPGAGPTQALIAMHGHPRDASKTFDAALRTVRQAGALERTLVNSVPHDEAAEKLKKLHPEGEAPPLRRHRSCTDILGGFAAPAREGTQGRVTGPDRVDRGATSCRDGGPELR